MVCMCLIFRQIEIQISTPLISWLMAEKIDARLSTRFEEK